MRDTLYSIIMIVPVGWLAFHYCWADASLPPNIESVWYQAVFNCAVPPGDNRMVFPMALPAANFSTGQALLVH